MTDLWHRHGERADALTQGSSATLKPALRCEVQFKYGLRQWQSRRLSKRPELFLSCEGKEIHVEKKTTQLNDVILCQGHAVHSALEREIHPIKVQVTVNTLEEYWGLRLVNMIGNLQA